MSVKGACLLGWIWLLVHVACGQERLVFYNLENLFDTSDDPHARDEEFTPGGAKHWTADRYADKLRRLAQALDSVGGGEWPAVIGVAEAENRRERIRRESQRELRELASAAARKLAFQPEADPFDQFLDLAEGGGNHESQ